MGSGRESGWLDAGFGVLIGLCMALPLLGVLYFARPFAEPSVQAPPYSPPSDAQRSTRQAAPAPGAVPQRAGSPRAAGVVPPGVPSPRTVSPPAVPVRSQAQRAPHRPTRQASQPSRAAAPGARFPSKAFGAWRYSGSSDPGPDSLPANSEYWQRQEAEQRSQALEAQRNWQRMTPEQRFDRYYRSPANSGPWPPPAIRRAQEAQAAAAAKAAKAAAQGRRVHAGDSGIGSGGPRGYP